MKELWKAKTLLVLLIIVLAGFCLMFTQKLLGMPLGVRYITTPIIILLLSGLFFFIIKPQKPLNLALSVVIIIVPLTLIEAIVTHTFVWKDINSPDIIYRMLYLISIIICSPLLASIVFQLSYKKMK